VTDLIRQIASQAVIPVLRSADVDDAVATARACAAGGLRVVELTCSTPRVEHALEALREDGLVVGLGTVTERRQVQLAADTGAAFVVSYRHFDGMVDEAHGLGLRAIPGALTPTEVAGCVDAGADVVKLFPGRLIEPAYLRDLVAVLPGVRLMVTGGIRATTDDVRRWLGAGALAVGVGSDLGTVASRGADVVEQRARALAALARR
jgi:2-dehydro-3-deoxyphosphogluconate aldolase/(4S)-4-hydroxy-2-oxoglutarate aldolase